MSERDTLAALPHALLFPPHPDGYYIASALCLCGNFQWDADNAEALTAQRDYVLADWREHVIDAGVTVSQPETPGLDLFAIDRLLAVEHREDDEPCSCDECMAYGAEDEGFDWYRSPAANRIAMRILDGADDRFAALVKAFSDHDAALAATPAPGGTGDTGPKVEPEPRYARRVPAELRRMSLNDLRNLAEQRGITYWDDDWRKDDFIDAIGRAALGESSDD